MRVLCIVLSLLCLWSIKAETQCEKDCSTSLHTCRTRKADDINNCKESTKSSIAKCKDGVKHRIDACKKQVKRNVDQCKAEVASRVDHCKRGVKDRVDLCKRKARSDIDSAKKRCCIRIPFVGKICPCSPAVEATRPARMAACEAMRIQSAACEATMRPKIVACEALRVKAAACEASRAQAFGCEAQRVKIPFCESMRLIDIVECTAKGLACEAKCQATCAIGECINCVVDDQCTQRCAKAGIDPATEKCQVECGDDDECRNACDPRIAAMSKEMEDTVKSCIAACSQTDSNCMEACILKSDEFLTQKSKEYCDEVVGKSQACFEGCIKGSDCKRFEETADMCTPSKNLRVESTEA